MHSSLTCTNNKKILIQFYWTDKCIFLQIHFAFLLYKKVFFLLDHVAKKTVLLKAAQTLNFYVNYLCRTIGF